MNAPPLVQHIVAAGIPGHRPQRIQHRRLIGSVLPVNHRQLGEHPSHPKGAVQPHIGLRPGRIGGVVHLNEQDRIIPRYAQRPQRLPSPLILPGGGRPFPGHPGRVKEIRQDLRRQLGLHPAEGGGGGLAGGHGPLPSGLDDPRSGLRLGGSGCQHKGERPLRADRQLQRQPDGRHGVGRAVPLVGKGLFHPLRQGFQPQRTGEQRLPSRFIPEILPFQEAGGQAHGRLAFPLPPGDEQQLGGRIPADGKKEAGKGGMRLRILLTGQTGLEIEQHLRRELVGRFVF